MYTNRKTLLTRIAVMVTWFEILFKEMTVPVHNDDPEVRIHKIRMGPYENNGYIVRCLRTGMGAIIDTPAEPEKLINELEDTQIELGIITHRDSDHIAGFSQIKAKIQAPIMAHVDDAFALPNPPEHVLEEGEIIKVGDLTLTVIHTPGHTPGSVCILMGKYLFSGDTLFPGGPGRTDSAEAFQEELGSIVNKLLKLPDETAVFPGHGLDTTIGIARQQYEVFKTRIHDQDLHGNVLWLGS